MAQPIRILVLNPNSSESMTKGMEKAIRQLPLPDVRYLLSLIIQNTFLLLFLTQLSPFK
jgi:hypothetical protein